jgi:membrane dipeptidase
MRRLIFLTVLVVTLTACIDSSPEAQHRDALVVDLHSDAALRMMEGVDFGQRDTTGDMDLPRLREGGIDLQVMACWLATETPKEECRPHVDSMLDSLLAQVSRNSRDLAVCRTAAEAEEIVDDGKVAVFIGIENGVAIASDLANLQHFYDRGVRYLTLTHTVSNDWCISSADTAPSFQGLTDFGCDVVRRMNELGMIVDISHASASAVEEVLKISTDPVIASHSCVYALCRHDRNLTDDQIKAIAANGGVIGINFYNGYLSQAWSDAADSLFTAYGPVFDSIDQLYADDRARRHAAKSPLYDTIESLLAPVDVNVATVVDHIDYIVKLVGPDYVCFGSDFDGVFALPSGLEDCSKVPNITRELVKRGYSPTDIRKILGGNFMRVFRKVCDS